MTLSIVATLKAKAGQEDALRQVALQLVAAVRANEPGCLLYTLSQGEDKSSFVFMERYADDAALAHHRSTDHYKTLGRAMGAHMDGPPTVLRMVEIG
jgi:quinol monooxygenase YgiN